MGFISIRNYNIGVNSLQTWGELPTNLGSTPYKLGVTGTFTPYKLGVITLQIIYL